MARMLIVDDEQDVLEELSGVFEDFGYEIDTATNGEEGIAKIRNNRPHVMLLDVCMPKMDGIQVLSKAKKIDPTLGVIMVTAVQEEEIAKQAIEYGAFDYITKPIDLDYLRKSVVVKLIKMLGTESVGLPSSDEACGKEISVVIPWPPKVLVSTSNMMRPVIRNMLRNCGIQETKVFISPNEIFSSVKTGDGSKPLIIFENSVLNVLENATKAKAWLGEYQKSILVFSGPKRKEIIEAIYAGIKDILTYPFSEAVLEKKLRKLTGTSKADAEKHSENRNSCRRDIPVVVVAPSLSDSPLVAEDVSSGGFRIAVSKQPGDNTLHQLSIQVFGQIFEACKGGVAWVKRGNNQSQAWSVGLILHMTDTERERFSKTLEEIQRTQDLEK
ncbi:response regulator [Nitrospinota bacterium]